MEKITLKDLAQILDMSISTVSRALSDHPDISTKTKAKVKEASQKYHYLPNLRARYLRTNSSGLIALILPGYDMFFIPTLMDGISRVVKEKGYSLLVFQSEDSYQKQFEIIEYCNQLSVDGILLSLGCGIDHNTDLSELANHGAPIVMLDRMWRNEYISTVGIECEKISHDAVEYLIKMGHTSIGGIFGNANSTTAIKRSRGFKEIIEKQNGEIKGVQLMVEHSDDFGMAMDNFLEENPDITAIYTMSDTLTLNLYHYLNSRNIRIPEDISLIVISDGTLPKVMHPNTTHFFHSADEVGHIATELLVKSLKGTLETIEHQRITCQLVEMNSVKNIN